MTPIEKRWLEVQLYNNLLKIYHKNNDIQDVITIIELISTLFQMKTEALKNLALKMLYNLRTRPTKKEYAILASHFKVPAGTIAKHTGYKRQYIYNQMKTWNVEDLNIYQNEYTEEEYNLMYNIINNIHELKEWLI
jgi:hypothetical protein